MVAERRRLIVNFHGIGTLWNGLPDDELAYWCPESEWLAITDSLARLSEQPGVSLEITFDDGNLSDFEHALPALVERGLTATFFPCAGRIGAPHYLSAEQLVELRGSGMSIGSHGWAHVDLRRADAEQLKREADDARDRLAQASQGPVETFAIPFGSYDRRVLGALRPYRRVYTSDRGLAAGTRWLTPRCSYTREWTPETPSQIIRDERPVSLRLRRAAVRALKRLR